jgi:hypothetical protein
MKSYKVAEMKCKIECFMFPYDGNSDYECGIIRSVTR